MISSDQWEKRLEISATRDFLCVRLRGCTARIFISRRRRSRRRYLHARDARALFFAMSFATSSSIAPAFAVFPVMCTSTSASTSTSITTTPGNAISAASIPISTETSAIRKPAGYWQNLDNLRRELRRFQHENARDMFAIPTSTELLQKRRFDLYRAIQRQGGFADCARRLGLSTVRRPRGYWAYGLGPELRAFVAARGVAPGRMPSTSELRTFGRTDILNAVQAAGGMRVAARSAGLLITKRARHMVLPSDESGTNNRHENGTHSDNGAHIGTTYRNYNNGSDYSNRKGVVSLDTVMLELRKFADTHCDGKKPLQRELVDAKRHDLLNAMRPHGGLYEVSTACGLEAPINGTSRRPRGYWHDISVVESELNIYMANFGMPGLMPRRDQLLRHGRSDLCYAIEKHGGFSAISARLHLVWVGPSNYWRVFRNLRKRLLAFIKRHGPKGVMPNILRLHQMGRTDLAYGVALHGGVMNVSQRLRLRVRYARRTPEYWARPENIIRELEWVLTTEPLERRTRMPSSAALVQAGRTDLANGVRDHGGWVYYAQRLGLRFSFERRVQGFWQSESNVHHELELYLQDRYGDWDFPGVPVEYIGMDGEEEIRRKGDVVYMPSSEMLKRDGRSDIAFAIQRYHGGEREFADNHGYCIAEDTIDVKPAEKLRKWKCFSEELSKWIEQYGCIGIMPRRDDFIRTGRHDLRYAIYYHGGRDMVAKNARLLICEDNMNDTYLAGWLALQAAYMGLVIDALGKNNNNVSMSMQMLLAYFEKEIVAPALSSKTRRVRVIKRKKNKRQQKINENTKKKKKGDASTNGKNLITTIEDLNPNKLNNISVEELDSIRERYKHVVSDDIIVP